MTPNAPPLYHHYHAISMFSINVVDCVFSEVGVDYRYGLSVFSVPLPSRKESCEFVLKPVSHTVKDFIAFIQHEDKGVDRVALYRDSKWVVLHNSW